MHADYTTRQKEHTSVGQFLFAGQDSICLSGYQGKSALACQYLGGKSLSGTAPMKSYTIRCEV